MGVYYLGWFDSGVTYNLWTVNEPALDSEGNLDVSGIRLRGNPVYNAFFTNYLGAQVIDIQTTDVYSALERGTVDATGWTQIGLVDLRWDEFLELPHRTLLLFHRSRRDRQSGELERTHPGGAGNPASRRRSSTSAPASRPLREKRDEGTLPFSRSAA